MILSLYQLQAFYLNEINRGVAGLGEYTIASAYGSIQVQNLDSIAYLATHSPEEIVMRIRDGALDSALTTTDITVKSEHDEKDQPASRSLNISSVARAKEVLKEGNINFDNKLHCFTVKGTSGIVRVVTLFPKETCSCPSTGECYHLLAVRLSIGMAETKGNVARHNLTILRKNTRSRKEKKCGRKRPRPNDEEPEYESSKYSFKMILDLMCS